MNKIDVYKIVILALLAAMLFAFNNCMPKVPGQESSVSSSNRNPSSTPTESETPPPDEGQVLNQIQVEVGVKNYEQILQTMSVLTGVSPQDNGVRSVYTEIQTSLPTENDAKIFAASHQVAVTKLAAEFCQVLVESATLRAAIWPNFNFGQRPNQNAFVEANRLYLIDGAVSAFWIIASDQEKAMAEQSLLPLFDELLLNENQNSATTTRNVVKGICTAILSSVQVTLL